MKSIKLKYDLELYILDKNNSEDIIFIKLYKNTIYELLKKAYEAEGGCTTYMSANHMFKNAYRYKIVFNSKTQQIYAAAIYRYFEKQNSFKCTLIGANKTLVDYDKAKYGAISIIQSDIINFKHLYWIEASDKISHWEEKYGAYKIPAIYAKEILEPINIEIIDDFKYSRKIQKQKYGDYVDVTKEMYGFSSNEILNKILSGENLLEYENKLAELYDGKINSSLYESYSKSRYLTMVLCFNYVIDNYYESSVFRNISKTTKQLLYKLLCEAVTLLKKHELKRSEQDEFEMLYSDCVRIYQCANVITLTKLF